MIIGQGVFAIMDDQIISVLSLQDALCDSIHQISDIQLLQQIEDAITNLSSNCIKCEEEK